MLTPNIKDGQLKICRLHTLTKECSESFSVSFIKKIKEEEEETNRKHP